MTHIQADQLTVTVLQRAKSINITISWVKVSYITLTLYELAGPEPILSK